MTKEEWVREIVKSAEERSIGELDRISEISQMLLESETAKQMLRDSGFGCTGMNIVETVKDFTSSRVKEKRNFMQQFVLNRTLVSERTVFAFEVVEQAEGAWMEIERRCSR